MAKEQGFIRDNLEKVMRLIEILGHFHNSPLLSKTLVLKGGTAINLTVFKLPRLSVDIDLDFSINCSREDNLVRHNLFQTPEENNLLRKTTIFYLTVGSSRKSSETPVEFTAFPQIDKVRFPQIRSQLLPVLKRSEHFDFEAAKTEVKTYLANLLILTDEEKEYVENFNLRRYTPVLLFPDAEIIERIKSHPMALWKIGIK